MFLHLWYKSVCAGDAVDKGRVDVASLHARGTETHPRHTRVENVVVRSTPSAAGPWTNCKDHSAILLTDSIELTMIPQLPSH